MPLESAKQAERKTIYTRYEQLKPFKLVVRTLKNDRRLTMTL
jgi:hypothetical protein